MRWALVVVLLVSFAAAAHSTHTYLDLLENNFKTMTENARLARKADEARKTRELTPEEMSAEQRANNAEWDIRIELKHWRFGCFVIAVFAFCALVWFFALVFFPLSEASWSRIQWITAFSIWVALLGGIVCVPVVMELDWYKMEMRWLIGATGGAIAGAILGTFTMGMRKNWEPRRYKTDSGAPAGAMPFTFEESASGTNEK